MGLCLHARDAAGLQAHQKNLTCETRNDAITVQMRDLCQEPTNEGWPTNTLLSQSMALRMMV